MNLTISGHHLEVTPALRGYVTTKLDRIARHFDQVVDIKVLFHWEGVLKAPSGHGNLMAYGTSLSVSLCT